MSLTFRARLKIAASALVASALLAVPMAASAQVAEPPPNDDVANAVSVTGLPTTATADVSAATTEDGEPLSACIELANTVWYALTLPSAAAVEVDTAGSDFDTAVVVWPETTDGDVVACAADTAEGPLARLSFSAEAGRTYLIQVGVQLGELAPGTGTLEIDFRVAPKPTGRPDVFGSRSHDLFALALWESFSPTGWQRAQVRLVEGSNDDFRQPNARDDVLVQVQVRRFDTNPDGSWFSQEWVGTASPDAHQFHLHRSLRDAAVDTELVLEYSSCTAAMPDEPDPDCTDIVEIPVRVVVAWTGQGATERAHLHTRDGGIGFRFDSNAHLAWRDAAGVGSLAGDGFTLADGTATIGVLGREAVVQTFFLR